MDSDYLLMAAACLTTSTTEHKNVYDNFEKRYENSK